MPFWMCTLCGHCLNTVAPPDKCPHCQQACSFRNVTCYRPECGGEQNIDPLLTADIFRLMKGVLVSTENNKRMIYLSELTAVQLFDGLTEEQEQKILDMGISEVYEPGTIICRENDKAQTLYIVEEGTIAIEVENGPSKRIPVCTVSKGGVFGWSCLVPPYRLTASVISLSKSKCLAISGNDLQQLCNQDPIIGFKIMQNISSVASSRLKNLKLELMSVVRA